MFETAEIGRKVSKKDFKAEEPLLHTALLEVQRELRHSAFPVVLIISGVEGAGKGEVVSRLNQWFDTRGVQTFAFWDESDEERERPTFWRFWRTMPPHGSIGIMFGSWYTQPIIKRVLGDASDAELDQALRAIAGLERTLSDDGTLLIKFWFHLSKQEQRKRLEREQKKSTKTGRLSPLTKKFSKSYGAFLRVSERAIRLTDFGHSPWHIVEATDRRYRDLTVGKTVLEALKQRLENRGNASDSARKERRETLVAEGAEETILDHVDLTQSLAERQYQDELAKYQRRLSAATWQAHDRHRSVVAVFEGWDAAGRGGAIRRVTAAVDARLYRVISVAAPTDEEKAHHYLWRFWRHVPRAGNVTIYDRSWYGRVLVERVEALAVSTDWARAYQEINEFESQLTEHGIVLVKYWIHISKDEQLRRFEERGKIPWKKHKITDEDWRNREKWSLYSQAINEMIARTSTEDAPWILIPGNDKKFARVEVVKTLTERIEQHL